MTIRHLKIFIAVAETGKMSLAAKKLYLAQPTISQAIHELEGSFLIWPEMRSAPLMIWSFIWKITPGPSIFGLGLRSR